MAKSPALDAIYGAHLRALASKLEAANGGRWSDFHAEFQDDGRFVLVSVEVGPLSHLELEAVRADLRSVLRCSMPDRPDDYSWSAVIKQNGVVMQSLMGGCSGSLPEI